MSDRLWYVQSFSDMGGTHYRVQKSVAGSSTSLGVITGSLFDDFAQARAEADRLNEADGWPDMLPSFNMHDTPVPEPAAERFGMNEDGTADDIVVRNVESVHVEDLGAEVFIAIYRNDGSMVDLRVQPKDGDTSGFEDRVRLVLMDGAATPPPSVTVPRNENEERVAYYSEKAAPTPSTTDDAREATYGELLQLLRDGNLSVCAQPLLAELIDYEAALTRTEPSDPEVREALDDDPWLSDIVTTARECERSKCSECGNVYDGCADEKYRETYAAIVALADRLAALTRTEPSDPEDVAEARAAIDSALSDPQGVMLHSWEQVRLAWRTITAYIDALELGTAGNALIMEAAYAVADEYKPIVNAAKVWAEAYRKHQQMPSQYGNAKYLAEAGLLRAINDHEGGSR